MKPGERNGFVDAAQYRMTDIKPLQGDFKHLDLGHVWLGGQVDGLWGQFVGPCDAFHLRHKQRAGCVAYQVSNLKGSGTWAKALSRLTKMASVATAWAAIIMSRSLRLIPCASHVLHNAP